MTATERNNLVDQLGKLLPNVILVIAMWWFSSTTQRNASVDKLEVRLESILMRLDKIETRIEKAEIDRYNILIQEVKSMKEQINK